MRVEKIDFEKTKSFSRLFLDYVKGSSTIQNLIAFQPDIKNFKKVIEQYSPVDRTVLSEVITEQYKGALSQKENRNLELLNSETTFTITTGHQLNLFTGPLFFIFKILTTVNLCERLKEEYPEYDFIPVYWMATEDHDFAEINHFHLFGKKYTWNSDQKGAVGRFDLSSFSEEMESLPEDVQAFYSFYEKNKNLTEATRALVHELFSDYGVLSLDADDIRLKKKFVPVMKRELLEQVAFNKVSETNNVLNEKGVKAQVNPRELNLFYLTENDRLRIDYRNNVYSLVGSEIEFSEEEILQELENHPDRFSPNVLLRPVYQQQILPNLAYIGGPGEFAYWIQLKSLFDELNVDYPVLIPRNFGMIINNGQAKKIDKLGLSLEELFFHVDELKKKIKLEESELDFSVENQLLIQIENQLVEKAVGVDASLEGRVKAELTKVSKQLNQLQKKIEKAEEQQYETKVKQVVALKEKLFPEGGLQERHDNFLNFYINDSHFIAKLKASFDPFDFSFNVIFHE